MKTLLDSDYWDSVARGKKNHHLEKNIALYKRDEHLRLIKQWSGGSSVRTVLKTDLYEEAFGNDDFLPCLLKEYGNIFGMDISREISNKAKNNLKDSHSGPISCVVSDIRKCAFRDESFDLIISNSTIDNLRSSDSSTALSELRRVLKPKGTLILTLDNRNNPLYFLGYQIEKLLSFNGYYQGKCYSIKEAKSLALKNNFKIDDITSIVHIPTPFNKMAVLAEKAGLKFLEKPIRYAINRFSKLGGRRSKFLTGWFIALRLVKE